MTVSREIIKMDYIRPCSFTTGKTSVSIKQLKADTKLSSVSVENSLNMQASRASAMPTSVNPSPIDSGAFSPIS